MRNQKGISLIKLIIIIAVILFVLFLLFGGSSKYELSVADGEQVALASLRTAIAQSRVDGSGTLSTENFNTLKKIVKNANSNNQWFSENKTIYYGKTADTSSQEITYISDGTYVAKFTIEIENPNSFTNKKLFLVDYSFEEGTIQGASFIIK
ncbi:MAG: hypothetical protein ACI4VQ_01245 [Clostridia bacterium]